MLQKNLRYFPGIVLVITIMIAAAGCTSVAGSEENAKSTINQTLLGQNLTYFSIAGKPLNHTITSEDIVSIEPVTYQGKNAWMVRVGTSLAWNLTMSADGTQLLEKDQLFRT